MSKDFKPHIFVTNIHSTQKYKFPPRKIDSPNTIPERNRGEHANLLLKELSGIWNKHHLEREKRDKLGLPHLKGQYVSFSSAKNNYLMLSSLNSGRTTGAELLNVQFDQKNNKEIATVFIPENKKDKLSKSLNDYLTENSIRHGVDSGNPKNMPLINRIENLAEATARNLWTSNHNFIPKEKAIWVELWVNGNEKLFNEIESDLKGLCDLFDIELGRKPIHFPERTIIKIKVNWNQLEEFVKSFGYIAELRKPEELNSYWLNQTVIEREDWISNALEKVVCNETNNFISILDTGVNNGHFLIAPFLDDSNKLSINENWGNSDVGGHGTRMAGVAIYGNLNDILENPKKSVINHSIESIKIIPPKGINDNDSLSLITQDTISIAAISNPHIKRIYCFANTGKNQFDFGKPSTWSATIDKLICGVEDNIKKIFVVSVGNVTEEDNYENYPENNLNLQIESPAQSWNSISVGAFTQKTLPNKKTVALRNELSPFSRTSNAWENNWPIKPDVVFEGGNLLKLDNGDVDFHNDLEILTTSEHSTINQLTTINATSAATAFAANFIAKLRHIYPNAWEETLRGLVIHSASWTDAMKKQMNFNSTQSSIINMLRTYGYGVPSLEKAIESKSNYLTFISEQILQPYIKNEGREPTTNDVHFYKFPWPKEILEDLGSTDVTIRVTLSYFIEPNPGEKGYSNKYSYQSTALKFALIPPNDEPNNFMLRINNAAREELKNALGVEKLADDEITKVKNIKWELGADNVFKGSVHSNYWKTNAAEASACNYIAVYPQATGWWKNLKKQEKYNEKLRYSLIVSIETPESTEDIYTKIAQQVKVENLIKV